MGGSSRGFLDEDLSEIEKIAKQSIQQAAEQIERHIFISFAYEDIDEVDLLRGQSKNKNNELNFSDYSVKEPFDSENANYIKAGIKEKIRKASVTLVYLSSYSVESKWVDWEIRESIKMGKGVIGVYKGNKMPSVLPSAIIENNIKCVQWNHSKLMSAMEEVSSNREK